MANQREQPWAPTRQQLLAAQNTKIPDILRHGLDVLFCGINPGLYSAAVQHHFGRPGNRFWPAVHLGGFTPRLLSPFEEQQLLTYSCGITNVVERATASADQLADAEFVAGAAALERKIRRYQPRFLAILGVGAYRTGFQRPKAKLGLQTETIGVTQIWVLPSPSGLNAHYQLAELGKMLTQLRAAVLEKNTTDRKE
jgi:TDG/mug DNA glycosylase family protein